MKILIHLLTEWVKTRRMAALTWLILQALILSSGVTILYHYIFVRNHFNMIPEDLAANRLEDPKYYFGLIGAWMFFQANGGFMQMMSAIKMQDETAFQKEYYKRSPLVLDGIMTILALSILWIKVRVAYEDVFDGYESVFKTFFIMYLWRQFTMGLYDPTTSILSERKIPPQWMKNIKEK